MKIMILKIIKHPIYNTKGEALFVSAVANELSGVACSHNSVQTHVHTDGNYEDVSQVAWQHWPNVGIELYRWLMVIRRLIGR